MVEETNQSLLYVFVYPGPYSVSVYSSNINESK
jgi:hypothetical protein